MLKNISSLGVALSKAAQKQIMGGKVVAVDKCCIRVPTHGVIEEGWCNSSPQCCGVSHCACYPCTAQS